MRLKQTEKMIAQTLNMFNKNQIDDEKCLCEQKYKIW